MDNKLIHDTLNNIYDEAESMFKKVKEKFPNASLGTLY